LGVRAANYFQLYDRPKRGAITILFRVSVQRHAVRMHFPADEISDIGFFDRLPTNATPSAKFFLGSRIVLDENIQAERYGKSGRGFSIRRFSATIYGEEGEREFRLSGESDADANTKVAIHGRWVAVL